MWDENGQPADKTLEASPLSRIRAWSLRGEYLIGDARPFDGRSGKVSVTQRWTSTYARLSCQKDAHLLIIIYRVISATVIRRLAACAMLPT